MQVRSLGREDPPGGGNGNPLQYSCLENPPDRGAWCATVHGVAKSWTQLSTNTHTHTHTHIQAGQQGPVCFDLYALQIHCVPGLLPDTLYTCVVYLSQFRALGFRELTLPASLHREAMRLEHRTQGGWALWEQRLHLHQLPWAEMSHPGYRGGSAVLAAPPCPAWEEVADSDLLQHTLDQGGGGEGLQVAPSPGPQGRQLTSTGEKRKQNLFLKQHKKN